MSIDRGRARRDPARAPCYTAAPAVTPWLRLLLAAAAIVAASCQSARDTAPPVRADIRLGPDGTTTEAVVPPNATLESLFRQERMPAELSASILQAVRGVFNPRHLRADQVYRITRTVDGLFREFRYEIDADNVLRVAVRRPGVPDPAIDVAVLPLPKEYEASAAVAEITRDQNSLIGAFEAAGENVHLPLQVAEIFGGEVDFNADLQLGDRVEVLFERATREGEFIGYGDVEAAVLHIGTRRLLAFRFEGADGKVDWYDAQGRSLKRQFLRSPFSFNPRVTSGFSYNRFHPVHGTRRPHLGVDYGAPYGTQVKAVAAGVVERAAGALRDAGATGLRAVVGPCIHPCCYEFGVADLDRVAGRYGDGVRAVTTTGRHALDLPAAVGQALAAADADVVAPSPACTACGTPPFFSHRARGDTARQAMVVWIETALRERPSRVTGQQGASDRGPSGPLRSSKSGKQ